MPVKIDPRVNSETINLIIGGIGISCFLLIPILSRCKLFNCDALEYSQLAKSLDSVDISVSGVALLVSACPMALDLIMDFLSGSEFSSIKSKKCWIGRAAITIATLMVGLQIALKYDYFQLFEEYAVSHLFGIWCLRIVVVTSFLFCLCTVNPTIFTINQTALLSTVTVVISAFRFFGSTSTSTIVNFLYGMARYIWLLFLVGMLTAWIPQLWKLRKKWTVDDYTCIYFLFLFIITIASTYYNLILAWFHGSSQFDIQSASTVNLIVPIYLHTACSVIMSIIPGRIARIEAIVSKDHVIETKQAYVRYISHELRTPLNTVYMGLTLSIDQIPADSKDPIEKERRSTLLEVWCACEVALDILNDLLLYDKLQHGLVSLTKEKLVIVDFMTQCINMFTVQLRLKKLQLTLFGPCSNPIISGSHSNNNTTSTTNATTTTKSLHFKNHKESKNHNNTTSTATTTNDDDDDDDKLHRQNLNLEDTIDADKSKLSQVIRNLLSNAIKFTPEGGDIQVSVVFIPFCDYYLTSSGCSDTAVLPVLSMLSGAKLVGEDDTNHEKESSSSVLLNSAILDDENVMINSSREVNKMSVTIKPFLQQTIQQNTISSCDYCMNHKGMLVIEVKDSGVGISLENQRRLFKEIIQFKPEVLQGGGGSGLGLFITKGIVDLHGGQISVHSEGEGKGTTIRLEIPMTRNYINTSSSSSSSSSTKFTKCTCKGNSGRERKIVTMNTTTATATITTIPYTPSSSSPPPTTHDTSTTKMDNGLDSSKMTQTQGSTTSSSTMKRVLSDWNFRNEVLVCPKANISDNNTDNSSRCSERDDDNDEDELLSNKSKDIIIHHHHYHNNNNNNNNPLNNITDVIDVNMISTKTLGTTLGLELSSEKRQFKSAKGYIATHKSIILLIVDDSSLNRKMLRRLLEAQGYLCEEAADGQKALNMIKVKMNANRINVSVDENSNTDTDIRKEDLLNNPTNTNVPSKIISQVASVNTYGYDAILMDFVMPVMNGPTATTEIRKLGYTGPIIGVTGNALDADKELFMAAGASHVFTKPLDISYITKALQESESLKNHFKQTFHGTL